MDFCVTVCTGMILPHGRGLDYMTSGPTSLRFYDQCHYREASLKLWQHTTSEICKTQEYVHRTWLVMVFSSSTRASLAGIVFVFSWCLVLDASLIKERRCTRADILHTLFPSGANVLTVKAASRRMEGDRMTSKCIFGELSSLPYIQSGLRSLLKNAQDTFGSWDETHYRDAKQNRSIYKLTSTFLPLHSILVTNFSPDGFTWTVYCI